MKNISKKITGPMVYMEGGRKEHCPGCNENAAKLLWERAGLKVEKVREETVTYEMSEEDFVNYARVKGE